MNWDKDGTCSDDAWAFGYMFNSKELHILFMQSTGFVLFCFFSFYLFFVLFIFLDYHIIIIN